MSRFPFKPAIASLIASVFFLGCGSGPKASIERVLREDKEIGSQFQGPQGGLSNAALTTWVEGASNLVRKMKRIDLSGCPPEFSSAYLAHARAWENLAEVIQGHPNIPTGMEGLVAGFINGLAGDPTGGAFEVTGQIRTWQEHTALAYGEVKSTWNTVEDIAVRNGARLP